MTKQPELRLHRIDGEYETLDPIFSRVTARDVIQALTETKAIFTIRLRQGGAIIAIQSSWKGTPCSIAFQFDDDHGRLASIRASQRETRLASDSDLLDQEQLGVAEKA